MKLNDLRRKYPKFIYEKYTWRISKNPRTRASTVRGENLEIFFDFRVLPDIFFSPKIIIENIDKKRLVKIGDRELNNLIFHLGLMEIPSYWKVTCSPEIEIKTGSLNSEQISFWKDLIIQGMGQFFYENKIDFTQPNFLRIISKPEPQRRVESKKISSSPPSLPLRESSVKNECSLSKTDSQRPALCKLKNRYLVPVGGGKDSIVTLELLKRKNKEINGFLVNPTKAAKEVLKVAKIKNPIVIERKIDPTLLKLNQKGYLNGHTPFTAVLSFLSVFGAVLFDYKNIVFSNEKSANEGNLIYLGKMINHQWSKSSEFERKFKNYCKKYLVKDINYFSLLRPYTELEISRMFLKYPQYFSVFSSCNVDQKMVRRNSPQARQRWCGNCPKCLFVYATLYPFLEKKELLKIFGRDIFQNKKLLPIMKSLIGQGRPKPFECVGTKKESRLAFYLSFKKAKKSGEIPYLLTKL